MQNCLNQFVQVRLVEQVVFVYNLEKSIRDTNYLVCGCVNQCLKVFQWKNDYFSINII